MSRVAVPDLSNEHRAVDLTITAAGKTEIAVTDRQYDAIPAGLSSKP